MHFLVTAPGHRKIVTHIFTGGDPYLTSDAVFGVKSSLIADFRRIDGATAWQAAFDFVMMPDDARAETSGIGRD